jgi:hypothetical protein
MDYTKLKTEIKEISEIASSVPEQFRDRCFEVLLSHLLAGGQVRAANVTPADPPPNPEANTSRQQGGVIPTPSQIRILMSKTGVTAEDIGKILFIEDGAVHFVREPSHTTVAKGQIEWSLLLALKNGLINNSLVADPEEVRSVCQDKGFYDKGNFAKNFKNNQKYFKDLMKAQGDAQALTTDGQEALGSLIKSLASTSS